MDTFFATKINSSAIFTDKGRRQTVTYLKAEPLIVKRVMPNIVVCALARKQLKELKDPEASNFKPGDQIKAGDIFTVGDIVKVSGISKGRGFAGVVKRHGFHGGPKAHGQSDRHRAPGSIGMRTTPGRVWKGKRMAGHYGVDTVTIKNLQVINLDEANNLVTVSGTVPGSRNGLLTLTKL